MKNTCKFYGWDKTFVILKLQQHATWNNNIKHQRCTVISCNNWGDHIRISKNGYANLVYCHAHASAKSLCDLIRCEKPRGYFYSVWNGRLQLLYETKYVAVELLNKIKNPKPFLKRYTTIENELKQKIKGKKK